MKVLKAALLTTALVGFAVSPLNAASMGGRSLPSPFGFNGFGPYTPSTQNTGSNGSPGSPTLQTAACLYNSCGSGAPGTTANTPPVANSFTPKPTYSQSYGLLFNGGLSRVRVYSLNVVRGGTQQPTFSGGLTPTNILGDPLANPEPTSIALFGAGLLVLGLARKRMARKP